MAFYDENRAVWGFDLYVTGLDPVEEEAAANWSKLLQLAEGVLLSFGA